MALHWAFKLFFRSGSFLRTTILLLWLCFFGLLVTQVVQLSTQHFLNHRAHESLAADVAVSAFRDISAEEKAQILEVLKPTKESYQIEISTMATYANNSLLIELKAIDDNFPLYGQFEVEKELSPQKSGLWVYPEVLTQLQVNLGDQIQVGQIKLPITRIITDDPGYSQTTTGIAPRVYLSQSDLSRTLLLQPGSQIVHRYYFKIDASHDEIEGRADTLERSLKSTNFFIRTPEDGLRFLERALEYFRRFVATLALLVAGLSFLVASFQLQKWLSEQTRTSMVLMSVGATTTQTILMTAFQLFTLSLAAWALAWVSVSSLANLLNGYFLEWFPRGVRIIAPASPGFTFIFAIVLAGLALLAFVQKIKTVSPLSLLQEESESTFKFSSHRHRIVTVLAIVSFVVLIFDVFNDFKTSIYFSAGIAIFSVFTWLFNLVIFRWIARRQTDQPLTKLLPWLYLSRLSFSSLVILVFSYFVIIALTAVPQLKASLLEELQGEAGDVARPSLFLMNIPENKISEVEAALVQKELQLDDPSPFILGQLRKHNDQPVTESLLKKYPVRVSYRDQLLPSEQIVAGNSTWPPFTSDQKRPWISLEKEFAYRNGFKLGDVLTFDIQGVEVEGEVKNFRRVKWSSFQPNFFIQFQSGVLEDAPKTFIGTLKLKTGQESALQFELSKQFPGISVINIVQTVRRVLELTQKVVTPIQVLSALTMGLCLLLMTGLVRQTLQFRVDELKVFHAVGADSHQVMKLIINEFGIIILNSLIMGSIIGLASSSLIATYFLNLNLKFDFVSMAIGVTLFSLGTLVLVYQTARSVVRSELKIKS